MRTDQLMALLYAEVHRSDATATEYEQLERGLVLALYSMNQTDLAAIIAEATFTNESGFKEYLDEAYRDLEQNNEKIDQRVLG